MKICFALVISLSPLYAQLNTTSGQFTVEPATLVSLGFEWKITGDDNRNANVTVTYRKKGEPQWHNSLPLMRQQREQIGVAPGPGAANEAEPRYPLFKYTAANMFAGSILNLEADTEYECRFTLSDPDGVSGLKEKTATVRTRKEPVPAEGGHTYHVYPVDWQGPKQQPAFTGLMAAYYMGSAHFDYENAFPPRVQPGDIILVHAGLYVGDRFHYMNGAPRPGYLALANLFDGTYYLTQSGTAEKPIVIKGAGDGEVIFDGAGCQTFFNLMGANYNYFEGITFRNANVAFLLGIKGIAGSSGFTLKHSKIYDIGRVIQDDWSGSKNFYIADNTMVGRHDPNKMMGWNGSIWQKFPGYPELLLSEYAVKVYGQGHVVAYNYVANWHDGIDVATYGTPDGAPDDIPDRVPLAIDFYNNDIFNMGDNCFETDGGARNIRVFRNRCFNSASGALSVQPMFGGPVYFYQNLVYNSPTGSLKYIEGSSGIYTYNNTIIGEGRAGPASNETFRNNLILAQGAFDPVFAITTYTNYTNSDYNGFRPNPGVADSFEWNTPPFSVAADFAATPVNRLFKTLKEYSEATGQEKHSVLLDYDIFTKVTKPDMTDPQRVYKTEDFDFRLKPNSAAVDAGVEIPGITDGFTGKAPDMGAYELGRELPHYGPR
ncbi:MAG TPA: hypothetical protein VK789_09065 [Bryobacteraceae bacterium]|nr:hypothetical protein [Bryobacteraceae bacterium]